MKQIVFKSGHSLSVTIPANFVNTLGIKPGDSVKSIEKLSQNRIVYIFSQSFQLSLLSHQKSKLKNKTKKLDKIKQ